MGLKKKKKKYHAKVNDDEAASGNREGQNTELAKILTHRINTAKSCHQKLPKATAVIAFLQLFETLIQGDHKTSVCEQQPEIKTE